MRYTGSTLEQLWLDFSVAWIEARAMKTGFELVFVLLLTMGCVQTLPPREGGPYGIPRHMPGQPPGLQSNDQTVDLAADAGSPAIK